MDGLVIGYSILTLLDLTPCRLTPLHVMFRWFSSVCAADFAPACDDDSLPVCRWFHVAEAPCWYQDLFLNLHRSTTKWFLGWSIMGHLQYSNWWQAQIQEISQFILVSFTCSIWAALGLGYILDQVEAWLGSPLLLTSLVRYMWAQD